MSGLGLFAKIIDMLLYYVDGKPTFHNQSSMCHLVMINWHGLLILNNNAILFASIFCPTTIIDCNILGTYLFKCKIQD